MKNLPTASSPARSFRKWALMALVIAGLPAKAQIVNIAPNGTAILGYNVAPTLGVDPTTLGTSYQSYPPGGTTEINTPADQGTVGLTNGGEADTFNNPGGNGDTSYVGIIYASTITSQKVLSLNLYLKFYDNGGWFGQVAGSRNPTLESANLDPNDLEVQVTTNGGTSWTEVASTNNYDHQLTGLSDNVQGLNAPEVTFDLTDAATNIDGIRIIGLGGDPAINSGSASGWIGLNQLQVEAEAVVVPEPSTYALMLGGLALLGFRLMRKSRQV